MFLALLYIGVASLLLALVTTPLVRDMCLRLQWVDTPGVRKIHDADIPRLGGVAVFLSVGLALGSAFFLPFKLSSFVERSSVDVTLLITSIAMVLLTGLVDDIFTIRAKYKLVGLIGAALVAYDAGVRVNYLGDGWAFPITMLWLVGCANAFNLIDGMDGLASGIGVLATLTIFIAAISQNNRPLVVLTVPLVCALLGFLRYNFNPASIFLGDCGSLTIGFSLACMGAIWSQKAATLLGLSAPLVAFAIPLTDVALAMSRRFLRKQSIFAADAAHIHHRLLGQGLTVRRSALTLYAFAAVASMASLAVTSLQQRALGGVVVLVFGAGLLGAVQYLGYREFSIFRRFLLSNSVRQMIDTQTRVEHLADRLAGCQSLAEAWKTMTPALTELKFHGVRLKLEGSTLEHFVPNLGAEANHWILIVPLSGGQCAELYAPLDDSGHFPVPALVQPLQRHLDRILTATPAVHVMTLGASGTPATRPVESVA